jgi:two-component system chemotaxis response regulator CheY
MEKTVVIADDDLNCVKYILVSLKNVGIKVLGTAINGNEAIQMIKKYMPDFLILDLKMPKKSGLEVLNEIEKLNCKTKVIIISGEISMVNRLNLVRYKTISDIIVKPFEFETLYSKIENVEKISGDKIEVYIDEILHEFSFNFPSKFYEYLLICIKKSIYRPLILKDIYKEVAKENNINANRMKWGIQKLILSMVRYTPEGILKRYFPYTESPSPKIFIYEIVKKVKEKMS